ncbi:MAG: hypothetical protein KGH65_04950 [Candidatus Micrarchaeota archaeon]|nr:hypothetical protein [Candidatus Micrarchaeota archaeon]
MTTFTLGEFSATLRDRDTISERLYRQVDRAEDRVRAALLRLSKAVDERVGEDATDDERNTVAAELYGALTDDELDQFQALNVAVIRSMVTEWSVGDVTADAILDLPHDTYEALADACLKAFRRDDFEPSQDPLAPTPDSAD